MSAGVLAVIVMFLLLLGGLLGAPSLMETEEEKRYRKEADAEYKRQCSMDWTEELRVLDGLVKPRWYGGGDPSDTQRHTYWKYKRWLDERGYVWLGWGPYGAPLRSINLTAAGASRRHELRARWEAENPSPPPKPIRILNPELAAKLAELEKKVED